jgi:peptidoglycan-associated lipoprotein
MVDEELATMKNHATAARKGSFLGMAALFIVWPRPSRSLLGAKPGRRPISHLAAYFGLSLFLLAGCAKDPGAQPGGLSIGLGGGGSVVATPGSPQDFVANVGDRVFFETDVTELTQTAKSTLDAQALWLARYGSFNFTVEGHADERGTREYNIALGARRAQNVKDYLVAKGINPNRIQTISYGKEKPVAVCNDLACWTQNRRAVTVLNGPGT